MVCTSMYSTVPTRALFRHVNLSLKNKIDGIYRRDFEQQEFEEKERTGSMISFLMGMFHLTRFDAVRWTRDNGK